MSGKQGNNEQMQWPQLDWDVCPSQKAGVDPDALLEADGEIRARYKRINALILVRHKQIVFERYYNGYSKSDVHHLASVTKSFLSALVGIAIDTGHIAGVDQKVLDFFPDHRPSRPDPARTSLTIERLLTMTSGLPGVWRRGREPLIERMHRSADWLQFMKSFELFLLFLWKGRKSSACRRQA